MPVRSQLRILWAGVLRAGELLSEPWQLLGRDVLRLPRIPRVRLVLVLRGAHHRQPLLRERFAGPVRRGPRSQRAEIKRGVLTPGRRIFMNTKVLVSISSSALLCLTLFAGCSAAPDGSATDVAADASSAGPEERGAPGEVGHEAIIRGPILCEPAVCNTAGAKEPGVAGGSCEAELCVCDAPTCGQLDQTPCAGNYCGQGHYDAWLNLCDNCGTNGATCCDYQHAGATTSCYDGLQCLNGFSCGACGAAGQPLCPNGYCNSGLVLAL